MDSLPCMHGSVEGRRGRRRPKRMWRTDIGQWTGKSVVTCNCEAKNRGRLQKIVDSSECPNGYQATGAMWRDVILWIQIQINEIVIIIK